MKKRILPSNKKSYSLFLKTLKKYRLVKQRLEFISLSALAKSRLERKLALLEKRVLSLNTKTVTGIATAVLLAWLANPAQAQFPAAINLDTLGSNGLLLQNFPKIIDINLGSSVSGIGDISGDGIDDILIGAPYSTYSGPGRSYIVFGGNFTDTLNLRDIDGSNGLVINSPNVARLGKSVSSAGDINGDDRPDIIIGEDGGFFTTIGDPNAPRTPGKAHVIFGSDTLPSALSVGSLGGHGFTMNGIDTADYAGFSVSGVGDFNNDGFDDVIVGAYGGASVFGPNAGESYLVFGSDTFTANSLNLSDLDGSNGFVIKGVSNNDYSGRSVSSAGDLNDDGFDDIIIGAYRGDPNRNTDAGESYVIFGGNAFTAESLNLSDLDGSVDINGLNGFIINGIDEGDYSGRSVSAVGDVNRDGIDDIIIGADRAEPNGNDLAGESYVVFGNRNFTTNILSLSDLNGTNGFVINGLAGDQSGYSVSDAGDVNGDGIDDILIGAPYSSPNGNRSGATYVVFGSVNFTNSLELSDLDGSNGFVVNGISENNRAGFSVSGAGDVNDDGVDDIIIGAPEQPEFVLQIPGPTADGEAYVVYGKETGSPTTPLLTTNISGLCLGTETSIEIAISDGDSLKGASKWFLYADNVNTTPIDSTADDNGMFTFDPPTVTTTYFVRGEGNGLIGDANRVEVNVPISITAAILNDTSSFTALPVIIGLTYQWIDCADDSPIDGETGVSYTPTTAGSYAVIVSDVCGSDVSDCEVFVGIDENSFGSTISLYPNPTSGDVILELGEVRDAVITLSDVTGKTINVMNSDNRNNILLPLKSFKKGIYFVTIAANNEQKVMKLIKE